MGLWLQGSTRSELGIALINDELRVISSDPSDEQAILL